MGDEGIDVWTLVAAAYNTLALSRSICQTKVSMSGFIRPHPHPHLTRTFDTVAVVP